MQARLECLRVVCCAVPLGLFALANPPAVDSGGRRPTDAGGPGRFQFGGGELLRSLELLAMEMLRLAGNEHEKISFDCMGHRKARLEELRLSARVAADKVRQSGSPYQFAPMSSRERRILHLALRDEQDLHTESDGEGLRRFVVLYPKGYSVPQPRGRR